MIHPEKIWAKGKGSLHMAWATGTWTEMTLVSAPDPRQAQARPGANGMDPGPAAEP